MSKEGRIKLGQEWKAKILANQKGGNFTVPNGVTLSHPYILEAEGETPSNAAPIAALPAEANEFLKAYDAKKAQKGRKK